MKTPGQTNNILQQQTSICFYKTLPLYCQPKNVLQHESKIMI